MKVYLTNLNESWIVDRLRKEWYEHNSNISTENIKEATVVWIIAPWLWRKTRKNYLKNKKVICSIYHFEKSDFEQKNLQEFHKRDKYIDLYHVISLKTKEELQKLTNKEIVYIPFWSDQNEWFEIQDKISIREKYNIPNDSYVIGSFQRDTEGKDLKSPKLIKGPDRFIEIIKTKQIQFENLLILLTGKRRQYVINELKKLNIDFKYFEMVEPKQLNELYNCLDLYIVASRKEGGPQAIVECGLSKTPIISTNVGIASEFLHPDSIFTMETFKEAKPNTKFAYDKSIQYGIPQGFSEYIEMIEIFK